MQKKNRNIEHLQQNKRKNFHFSEAYNELTSIDFCWRKHDECESIGAGETKFGITNDKEQPFWSCNCDMEFYDCLHRLNSTVSNRIGELHFNFYYRCYRADYEIQKCNEYEIKSINNRRCVQYSIGLRTPHRNQWFDLPFYSGQPMKRSIYIVKEENSDEEEDEVEQGEEDGEEWEEDETDEQRAVEYQEQDPVEKHSFKPIFLNMDSLSYSNQ